MTVEWVSLTAGVILLSFWAVDSLEATVDDVVGALISGGMAELNQGIDETEASVGLSPLGTGRQMTTTYAVD